MPSANITFSNGLPVGSTVNEDFFGSNFLFTKDMLRPGATFPLLQTKLAIDLIRYPGGTLTEQYFDISRPNATTQTSFFGQGSVAAVQPLDAFLSFCQQTQAKAVVVLPTYRFFDAATGGVTGNAETIVKSFVSDLAASAQSLDSIAAFEIGNEWYNSAYSWTAVEFASLQANMVEWIDSALDQAGVLARPKVLVQAGRGDDDANGVEDNLEFVSVLTPSHFAAIDGVVTHLYPSATSYNPLVLGGQTAARLDRIASVWEGAAARPLDLTVTEWNVADRGPDDTSISGLMRHAPLLRTFADMVAHGVDSALIWTAQNSLASALSGKEGSNGALRPTGYLFRMMNEALVGTKLIGGNNSFAVTDSSGNDIGYKYAFQGDGRAVLYLASGVNQTISAEIDASAFMRSGMHLGGTILGAAAGSSPDDYFAQAQIVHLNSTDFGARMSEGFLSVTLKPYELLQVEITFGRGVTVHGDDQHPVIDVILGSSFGDALAGFLGNDELIGMDGNDLLRGGAGADTMRGGNGLDSALYDDAPASVLVDLIVPSRNLGDAAGDVIVAVERLVGSSFADDLRGSGSAEVIDGASGDDWLIGRAGNDTLMGGTGNDVLQGGAGYDFLVGGDGVDRAAYGDGTASIYLDLSDSRLNDGFAKGDTLSSIENASGSLFSDSIWGDNLSNLLDGQAGSDFLGGRGGNDSLMGRMGDDTLDGGDGNDILIGGAGADLLIGGAGTDVAQYSDSAAGLVADLSFSNRNTSVAQGDTYSGVENVLGSQGNDVLAGDNAANALDGASGNDVLIGRNGADMLSGGDGNDMIIGGSGSDVLRGGAGSDVFVFRSGDGSDRIMDFQVGLDHLMFDLATTAGAILTAASSVGLDTWLDLGGGDHILIKGVGDPAFLLGSIDFGGTGWL